MQIAENWAEIRGTIVRCEESERGPEFTVVYIDVREVRDVPGFKNLARQHAERLLPVHIPSELCIKIGLKPAMTIACRVKMKKLNKFFVHREHITVDTSAGE